MKATRQSTKPSSKELTRKVFEDLDAYLNFCKTFGYVFNEKDLYKPYSPWGFYSDWKHGKKVPNNWEKDMNYEQTV